MEKGRVGGCSRGGAFIEVQIKNIVEHNGVKGEGTYSQNYR